LHDAQRQKEVFVHFKVANRYRFQSPILTEKSAKQRREAAHYRAVLLSMYAGDIGTALAAAFRNFNTDTADGQISSFSLEDLMFYRKLRMQGEADGRFFNTYTYDWYSATLGAQGRNNRCVPRVGSYALVSGVGHSEILVRITVRLSCVCFRAYCYLFLQALFVIAEENYKLGTPGYKGRLYPMVAGYRMFRSGSTVGHCRQYKYNSRRPIIFALCNGVSLRQVTVGYELHAKAVPDRHVEYLTGCVDPNVVVAIPETGLFDDLNIAVATMIAKVMVNTCFGL
jgi:hypothetical protein